MLISGYFYDRYHPMQWTDGGQVGCLCLDRRLHFYFKGLYLNDRYFSSFCHFTPCDLVDCQKLCGEHEDVRLKKEPNMAKFCHDILEHPEFDVSGIHVVYYAPMAFTLTFAGFLRFGENGREWLDDPFARFASQPESVSGKQP